MDYKDLMKLSKGNEEIMWKSIDHVCDLLETLKEKDPKLVREFMEKQYELMNGKHIPQALAKQMVSKMWHKDLNGNMVEGETITPEEAMMLISDKSEEKKVECRWDAYVAANAFAHDIAKSGVSMSKNDMLRLAKSFWYHDDDMGDNCHKVYWYFKDWIYE